MDGPPREGSLLKDPTATVDLASVNIATEVIDRAAHVVGPTASDMVHDDGLPLEPGFQKSIIGASGTRCRNDTIGRAEDFFHALGLMAPIFFVILGDAEGVNPEILLAQTACNLDCVSKGLRKGVKRDDPLLPAFDVRFASL